jgi:hypothetical protein
VNRIWKTGELCSITFAGRTVRGQVLLASPNGRSIMLEFEALLGGYAGRMPVLEEEGEFRDLVTKSVVVLKEL